MYMRASPTNIVRGRRCPPLREDPLARGAAGAVQQGGGPVELLYILYKLKTKHQTKQTLH